MNRDPLARAESLQREAAGVGFDWNELEPLWAKLQEEIEELRQACGQGPERVADELGDLLFMVVNLARHLGVDAGRALAGANGKFQRRFGYVMQHADELPPPGSPDRLDRMEALWVEAKRLGL